MKLEQLGRNFNLMSQTEQQIFFCKYVNLRAIDLGKPSTFRRPKKSGTTKKKGKNLKVTPEALEILKRLKLV